MAKYLRGIRGVAKIGRLPEINLIFSAKSARFVCRISNIAIFGYRHSSLSCRVPFFRRNVPRGIRGLAKIGRFPDGEILIFSAKLARLLFAGHLISRFLAIGEVPVFVEFLFSGAKIGRFCNGEFYLAKKRKKVA